MINFTFSILRKICKYFFFLTVLLILENTFVESNLYGNIAKISTMDKSKFWYIIDTAKNENQEECIKTLEHQLKLLSKEELIQFSFILELFAEKLDFPAMQMAHKVINGSHDQEKFKSFSFWIISNGQEIYYKALKTPDILSEIDIKKGTAYFKEYHSVINNILTSKKEDNMEDLTLSDDQLSDLDKDTIFNDEKYEINYREFYDLLPKTLPKLYHKYWNLRSIEEIESDKIHEEQLKNLK
ncbi:DUF4240 domain-containing protein [Fusobacterium sp. PH5-44]|uniref:DUF4240 domain-containing protein n=1 Tax=unclassified Fusobacterium TaxID=2648384 RepID=UPI003D1A4AE8